MTVLKVFSYTWLTTLPSIHVTSSSEAVLVKYNYNYFFPRPNKHIQGCGKGTNLTRPPPPPPKPSQAPYVDFADIPGVEQAKAEAEACFVKACEKQGIHNLADLQGHALQLDSGRLAQLDSGLPGKPGKPGTARSRSGSVGSADSSRVTSCSSKKSKARAERDRGPKRQAAKRERCKQHVLAKGGTWSDSHRADTAALALAESGSFKGSVATANYKACIKETNDGYVDEGPDARVTDGLLKEITVDQARYITMRADGNAWCHLCSKSATEAHIASSAHMMKMEESALSDAMGGQTHEGFRRFGTLCEGCPSKKKMMDFWGENITYLPQFAKEVHNKKKVFYINSRLDRPITVDQATHELGIVSYKGDGKYNASTYIPYHNLPDSEEVATEEQLRTTSPAGQGWWPVISLGEEYDKVHGRSVLLVCFYQLQLKEDVVPAWRIWPNWEDNRAASVPEAKAMLKSGVASSSAASSSAQAVPKVMVAKPKSGAASSSTAPPATGVWANQNDDEEFGVEMDEVW